MPGPAVGGAHQAVTSIGGAAGQVHSAERAPGLLRLTSRWDTSTLDPQRTEALADVTDRTGVPGVNRRRYPAGVEPVLPFAEGVDSETWPNRPARSVSFERRTPGQPDPVHTHAGPAYPDRVARETGDGLRQRPHAVGSVLAARARPVRPVASEAVYSSCVRARRDEVPTADAVRLKLRREVEPSRETGRGVDANAERGGDAHHRE